MATEFNTLFVPFQDIFNRALTSAPAEYWLGDGVHPTCAGHQLMANAWLNATAGII
jgi:phospholipase/lecithinase/hemolysin